MSRLRLREQDDLRERLRDALSIIRKEIDESQ